MRIRAGRAGTRPRRRGDAERAPTGPPPVEVRLPCSGRDRLVVEPLGARQAALAALVGRPPDARLRHRVGATLWPDSANGYDSLGVAVWVDGNHVGWLSHADSAAVVGTVRTLASAGEACECGAFVVVDGVAPDGTLSLGLELQFDLRRASARARAIDANRLAASVRSAGHATAS